MYAIFETGGKQFKVKPGDVIKVERLPQPATQRVNFDRVLAIADDGDINLGSPYLDGATVGGRLLSHGKDSKVTVFKMKRRKGYRKKQGHRQQHSKVEILEITPA